MRITNHRRSLPKIAKVESETPVIVEKKVVKPKKTISEDRIKNIDILTMAEQEEI